MAGTDDQEIVIYDNDRQTRDQKENYRALADYVAVTSKDDNANFGE